MKSFKIELSGKGKARKGKVEFWDKNKDDFFDHVKVVSENGQITRTTYEQFRTFIAARRPLVTFTGYSCSGHFHGDRIGKKDANGGIVYFLVGDSFYFDTLMFFELEIGNHGRRDCVTYNFNLVQ